MKLGTGELILILILVLIVFGAGKLSTIGGAIGKSVKDFRKEVNKKKDSDSNAV